jgi:Amino acid permease
MTTILILLTIGGCINNVASASRQLWSFARDGGLPFSKFLAHVGFPRDHDDVVNHPANKPRSLPVGIYLSTQLPFRSSSRFSFH